MNLESLLVLCQFLLSLVLVMSFHLFGKNQCLSSLFSVFARKLHTTLTFLMVYQLPPMQETTRKLKKKKTVHNNYHHRYHTTTINWLYTNTQLALCYTNKGCVFNATISSKQYSLSPISSKAVLTHSPSLSYTPTILWSSFNHSRNR